MDARFTLPSVSRRPPKSRRFDVHGLKVSRGLTLFNKAPVHAWLDLERTPAVTWYCERPLVIEEAGNSRVVDFYVIRGDSEEMLFCPTKAELENEQPFWERWPGFTRWCDLNQIKVEFRAPASDPDGEVTLANWGQILRELSAFRRYVSAELVSAVGSELSEPKSLRDLQSLFRGTDPILVKVALFQLLHQGTAVGEQLDAKPISTEMLFVGS